MTRPIALLLFLVFGIGTVLEAADNTFLDYQNYNHGYCPDCSCLPCECDGCEEGVPYAGAPCGPCDPCAPICGAECGISMCAIAVGVAAIVAAGAIILTAGSGGSTSHSDILQ